MEYRKAAIRPFESLRAGWLLVKDRGGSAGSDANLLDTHVFVWVKSAPENLSDEARAAIINPANDV